jgi:hypothetical protein
MNTTNIILITVCMNDNETMLNHTIWAAYPKSIYNIEQNANVVSVGTDIKFKIFSGKLLDVAPKSRLADGCDRLQ